MIDEGPRGQQSRRRVARVRARAAAVIAVLFVALIVVLAVSNTGQVKIHWLVDTSHVSLLWLVGVSAVFGWIAGLLTAAALRRRSRSQ